MPVLLKHFLNHISTFHAWCNLRFHHGFLTSRHFINRASIYVNGDPSFTFIGPMIESFFINANNRYAGSAIAVILAIVIVVSTYIINKADRTVVKDRLPKPAKTVNPIATDEERAAYEKKN